MSGKAMNSYNLNVSTWNKGISTNIQVLHLEVCLVVLIATRKLPPYLTINYSFITNPGFALGDNTAFGIVYIMILLWIFMGIGIVSDMFME